MPHACPASESTAEAAFRIIVESAADLIVLGDAERNRTYVSPSVREILGYEPADLLGKHAYQLVHPDDLTHVDSVVGSVTANKPRANLIFRMRRKNGTYVWIDARYRHLPQYDGILAILRDITPQKHAEATLEAANRKLADANRTLQSQAERDGLTGLFNRRHFDTTLHLEFLRARRHHEPLGLVMIDVDHFKRYNDRYGHLAGDECLRRISNAIRLSLARPGDIAARYGGEELVAALPATDLQGARTTAERMRAAIAGLAIEHAASPFGVVTVSAGASAEIPDPGTTDPRALLHTADAALYAAKTAGRNRVSAL
jgi:diguanylate cyclase (GGDEF)-like protein/PAS domain S-box-containing protein